MTQTHRGLLPETALDLFALESSLASIPAHSSTEFRELSGHIDDEHNWENAWIDIGGEG